MARLKCVSEYANSRDNLYFTPGQTFEVAPELARWLMSDAPGCFVEAIEPEPKALDAPPADKAVRAPGRKK